MGGFDPPETLRSLECNGMDAPNLLIGHSGERKLTLDGVETADQRAMFFERYGRNQDVQFPALHRALQH
jgi:hypothetical protein